MKKRFLYIILVPVIIISFLFMPSKTNANASKLRVGYVESEAFDLYSSQLAWMAKALQEKNILKSYEVDINEPDSKVIWDKICDNCISPNYEFVKDMYYNIKNMSETDIQKIYNDQRVDLVLVMGTVAGLGFTKNETKNKFMVLGAANPVGSGIVAGENDRGKSNAYAHIDRNRYKRQLQAGYKILPFKKVGVVYEDSAPAYSYSGISQLEEASKELNFTISTRHVKEAQDQNDYDRYYKELIAAYKELIQEGIDTLYITTATIQVEKLSWLLSHDIIPNHIVTIAQTSETYVKYGALVGVTILNTEEQGYFLVDQIQKFIEGTPFDQLEQVNDSTPKIYLNYDVAKNTGIKLPFSALLTVDTIYRNK